MPSKENIQNPDIFVSLQDLLKMEHFAKGFSFLARKQRVKSILGGKHASKLRGRGLDFEEVRNYVAGDDIRHIDWKVTARTQKTHSRVFSEEKEKPALIVVDQSKSMFFGSQKRMKSVVAAELAALSAYRVLKEGDRVGGIVFADNGIDILYPKRDRRNILRFLEKIVARNKELKDSTAVKYSENLRETLRRIQNIVTHDFLVIIISDFMRYSPEVIKFIAGLARRNDVVLAKIYDPMEENIMHDKFVAGSEDSQVFVEGDSSKIKEKFKNGFNSDLSSFETEMKKHKVSLLTLNTVEDVDKQIKELLSTMNVR
jgi:uncharacterized protein (DUF58 family)